MCYRGTGGTAARNSHLKSCARTNGVSTEQLLTILSLERRQAEERRALGLQPLPLNRRPAAETAAAAPRVRQPKRNPPVRSVLDHETVCMGCFGGYSHLSNREA
jgi:hypothetical protein